MMWQLIKRDYTIIFFFIIFAFLFQLMLHVFAGLPFFSSSNLYFLSFVLMMLYALLFYLDDRSKVMRTIVSLPIKKRHIIMSRYVSLYTIGLILLLFTFYFDYLIDQQAFHFIKVYVAVCALTIYIAISTPIYYLFNQIWVRIVVHYVLLIFSAFAFAFLFADPFDWFTPLLTVVFMLLDLQPLLMSALFLMVIMYGSYRMCDFIFNRKDVL